MVGVWPQQKHLEILQKSDMFVIMYGTFGRKLIFEKFYHVFAWHNVHGALHYAIDE